MGAGGAFRLPPGEHGVSLIELVIIVAVVAILAAVAVPSMVGLVNAGRLSGGVEELTASLHLARSEAIRRNRVVAVCGGQDGSDECTGNTAWTQLIVRHDEGSASDPAVIRRYEISGALQLESSDDEIRFRPSGTVDGERTVSVCLPTSNPAQNIRRVTVMMGGGVAVTKDEGGGSC